MFAGPSESFEKRPRPDAVPVIIGITVDGVHRESAVLHEADHSGNPSVAVTQAPCMGDARPQAPFGRHEPFRRLRRDGRRISGEVACSPSFDRPFGALKIVHHELEISCSFVRSHDRFPEVALSPVGLRVVFEVQAQTG